MMMEWVIDDGDVEMKEYEQNRVSRLCLTDSEDRSKQRATPTSDAKMIFAVRVERCHILLHLLGLLR